MRSVLLIFIIGLAFLVFCVPDATAMEYIVDSTVDETDSVPGDGACETASGDCTLRAAIQEANENVGADLITLPAGTFTLTIAGDGDNDCLAGDLDISDSLTIVGQGRAVTTIDGNELDRVFYISGTGVAVSIQKVTITGGLADSSLGNIGGGAYILNADSLSLTDCDIINNSANMGGGVRAKNANLNIDGCRFDGNQVLALGYVNDHGSALYFESTANTVSIINSTFSNNNATTTSTAAVHCHNYGSAQIVNSTISGNEMVGLRGYNGDLTVSSVTLLDNGGIGLSYGSYDGTNTLTVANSIIANNGAIGTSNCYNSGGIYVHSGNLESADSCSFDTGAGELTNTDPRLGALVFNGGGTPTHHPLAWSPVVDALDPAQCPTEDQRGILRSQDGDFDGDPRCDIGAIEADWFFADGFETNDTSHWSVTQF